MPCPGEFAFESMKLSDRERSEPSTKYMQLNKRVQVANDNLLNADLPVATEMDAQDQGVLAR
jgi:hypothetical protein